MVLQGQKLHEDSKSYKELEDFHEEYPQVNLILEDFVQSRRIPDILEAQESGKPRKDISSASRHVPAKDGKESPKEGVQSADSRPSGRPTYPRSKSASDFLFPTSSPDYITTP
jgi:hypothetical protein